MGIIFFSWLDTYCFIKIGYQNIQCADVIIRWKRITGTRIYQEVPDIGTLSSPCQFFKMALGLCDLPDILASISIMYKTQPPPPPPRQKSFRQSFLFLWLKSHFGSTFTSVFNQFYNSIFQCRSWLFYT